MATTKETLKRLETMKKHYGFPSEEPKKKAKKKKRLVPPVSKPKPKKITLPTGVRTKKQIGEWKKLMGM